MVIPRGKEISKAKIFKLKYEGDTVASWVVHSCLDGVAPVQALAGDIVLCSWARHFTLTVPLSTQVYKWVPANLMLEVTLGRASIPSRGSRNTPCLVGHLACTDVSRLYHEQKPSVGGVWLFWNKAIHCSSFFKDFWKLYSACDILIVCDILQFLRCWQ